MDALSTVADEATINADDILERIRAWVEIETPTYEGAQVNLLADLIELEMNQAGAHIERIPGRDGYGDIMIARSPWGGDDPGILVLCHIDTVHPVGTINGKLSFRREGDRVYGPGIYDMKGGVYLAQYAYRHLVREGRQTPLPITFLYVSEEEIGSPISREVIEREALRNKFVLVTEPARDGGKVVTSRKGVLRFDVSVQGRPAHSGSRPQDGCSAIREMAKQILQFEDLTDYDAGTTVNVGLVNGGTAINVVPEFCTAEVDMRVNTLQEQERVWNAVRGFRAFDPEAKLTITGGPNRPPYEKSPAIERLFEHAKGLAREIGFELEDTHTGGGSDGNFTAGLGIPTLDGLGVDGEGAHTRDEYIYYSCLVPRTRLLIRLFETLR